MSFVSVMDVRMDRFNAQFAALSDVLISGGGVKSDPAQILHDEARLFSGQVVRFTAPKNNKQGTDAVERDLKKLFTPVNEELLNTIGSQFGVSNINAWFTTATGERKNINWDRIDPTGDGMKAFHNRNRDSRGRVRGGVKNKVKAFAGEWRAAYVVSFQDFDRFKKEQQAHVGRKKAAWGKAFYMLGGHLPKWIYRHLSGAKGAIDDKLTNPEKPSVTMISFAPGVTDDARIVNNALKTRTAAMAGRMRAVVRNAADDWATNRKPRKRAQEWPAEVIE